jgi:hypothetical protein
MKSFVIAWTIFASSLVLTNAAFNTVTEVTDLETKTDGNNSSHDRELDSTRPDLGGDIQGGNIQSNDEVVYNSSVDGNVIKNENGGKSTNNDQKQYIDDNSNHSQQQFVDMEYIDHGHWGTPPTATITNIPTSPTVTTTLSSSNDQSTTARGGGGGGGGTSHTFLSKTTDTTTTTRNIHNHNPLLQHAPPEAFTLTAMIQQRGSRSVFVTPTITTTSSSKQHQDGIPSSIPFLECNSIGTTTPPIPTSNMSFRSFPKSAHPSSFTYTRGFIVPLSKIEIEVNSASSFSSDQHTTKDKMDQDGIHKSHDKSRGEGKDTARNNSSSSNNNNNNSNNKRIFSPGHVIWVDGEYRMTSAQESDLSVLIINVPNKRKEKSYDFFGIAHGWENSMILMSEMNCDLSREDEMGAMSKSERGWFALELENNRRKSLQKVALTLLGVALSSLMTFFWIKVAPLQLAVGIGGLCMVGGGTLGIVTLGEMICDEIVEYMEKIRQERMIMEGGQEREEQEEEEYRDENQYKELAKEGKERMK